MTLLTICWCACSANAATTKDIVNFFSLVVAPFYCHEHRILQKVALRSLEAIHFTSFTS